jgi:hypothetical protein
VFQRVPARAALRSLTPIATQAPAARAASPSRSVCGPGISTAFSWRRWKSSVASGDQRAQACAQRELGKRGTKASGSRMSRAPWAAASATSAQAFSTDAAASSTTGAACTTATRTGSSDICGSSGTGMRPGRMPRGRRRTL